MNSLQITTEINEVTTQLWQGKDIDVEKITKKINDSVQEIINYMPKMKQVGVNFPIEFVTAAMRKLTIAIEKRDDYMLADNLFFEWKEIFTVFGEIITEIEG